MSRAVAVVLAIVPVAAHLASLTHGSAERPVGIVFVVLALLVAATNAYLSFVRPTHYRHVSGIPMIGTAFATAGALAGYGSRACAVIGLVAIALDTGGWPWFVVSTWRDRLLWTADR